ncbi:hypothetical protein RB195_009173 [Necator americanus]|uniref:Uncharacterized protein n=1 Tax=Necator americanus TaxID=51031 RepID=A0ABR1CTS7_NECAM
MCASSKLLNFFSGERAASSGKRENPKVQFHDCMMDVVQQCSPFLQSSNERYSQYPGELFTLLSCCGIHLSRHSFQASESVRRWSSWNIRKLKRVHVSI